MYNYTASIAVVCRRTAELHPASSYTSPANIEIAIPLSYRPPAYTSLRAPPIILLSDPGVATASRRPRCTTCRPSNSATLLGPGLRWLLPLDNGGRSEPRLGGLETVWRVRWAECARAEQDILRWQNPCLASIGSPYASPYASPACCLKDTRCDVLGESAVTGT